MASSIIVPTATGTMTITPVGNRDIPNNDYSTVYAELLQQLGAFVLNSNAALQAQYDGDVRNYNASAASGIYTSLTVPVAPKSWVLIPGDPSTFTAPNVAKTGPPIVSTVALAPVNQGALKPVQAVPGMIHVTVALGNSWWGVGQDDGFPAGMTTPPVTSDDGVTGRFQKFGAPVGKGWYLKVG